MLLSYPVIVGHLHVHVMSMLYNWESILIGVDGSRLLRCHDFVSIYIPLGISNLDVSMTKSLDSIEFLFGREFMYAWNRKTFSLIWFCIWFKFNIIGITMPCA